MIARSIVFSDLHLRDSSADVVFNEVLPGLLAAAEEHNASQIICLGDIFHVRYRVSVALLHGFMEWVRGAMWQGIGIVLLPGNHDQVDPAGRHVLELFGPLENNPEYISNICVVTEPTWLDQGLFVPYRLGVEDMQESIRLPCPSHLSGSRLPLWLHGGVRGAMMNNSVVDEGGLPTHAFENFDQVFCGHYHRQQELGPDGKIVYVGSPYQTRADEAGQPKGYMLYDWQARRYQRVQTSWGPRYVTGRAESVEALVALCAEEPPARSLVRARLAPGVDLAAADAALRGSGHSGFTLTQEVEGQPPRLDLPATASLEEYAAAYLSASDAEDKAGLAEAFSRIQEVAP